MLLGQQSLDTVFGNLKMLFCWDENSILLVWQLLFAGMKIQIALSFEHNISPKWKLHFSLKFAFLKIKNSILSQKCNCLKMKLVFMVENQVRVKWKSSFCWVSNLLMFMYKVINVEKRPLFAGIFWITKILSLQHLKNKIFNQTSGFRGNHSYSDVVHKVVSDCLEFRSKNHFTSLLLLDFQRRLTV